VWNNDYHGGCLARLHARNTLRGAYFSITGFSAGRLRSRGRVIALKDIESADVCRRRTEKPITFAAFGRPVYKTQHSLTNDLTFRADQGRATMVVESQRTGDHIEAHFRISHRPEVRFIPSGLHVA